MQASAVLIVDDRSLSSSALNAELAYKGRGKTLRSPIACAEIFGESVLDRTVARLRKAGIEVISIIAGSSLPPMKGRGKVEVIVTDRSSERWRTAQQRVIRQNAHGIDTVFVIGGGAYIEWDVEHTLKFHRNHGMPLTQLNGRQGPLEVWAVNANWFSTAALGCTLPFRYGEFPGLPVLCPIPGYVNRLTEAGDLRQLVRDAFLSRCEIRPQGREVRPGIWVGDNARVHKLARLVAPVYLGARTTAGPSSVITRFSNIEQHCKVGAGTVVDSATVLSHTEIGAGLDVSRAVVDGNEIVDLRRNVALRIGDPNLIRDTTPSGQRGLSYRNSASQPNWAREFLEFAYSNIFSAPREN